MKIQSELMIIFYNAVMNQSDPPGLMGMGILGRYTSVGCPSGMSKTAMGYLCDSFAFFL
jgi:hypothetical protein